jgi:hypothetical protein
MRSFLLGRKTARATRHVNRPIGEIWKLFIEEAVDKSYAVVEFLRGQRPSLRDVMPIFEAGTAACRGRVLRVIDRVAFEGGLATVSGRFRDRKIFAEAITSGVFQRGASFTLSVPNGGIVNGTMKKMVAYQLLLKRFEGVRRIAFVTAMQTLPVDQAGPACSAFAALVIGHRLELFEAMQAVIAVGRRAFDVERRGLLELSH